jgi:hypothetical protein
VQLLQFFLTLQALFLALEVLIRAHGGLASKYADTKHHIGLELETLLQLSATLAVSALSCGLTQLQTSHA